MLTPGCRVRPRHGGWFHHRPRNSAQPRRIRRKDVRVGDTIIVHKAGDVIPEVVGPMLTSAPTTRWSGICPSFAPPAAAPWCMRVTRWRTAACRLDCPAQLKERLIHWVSRGCMDVDGLGDELIGQNDRGGSAARCRRFLHARCRRHRSARHGPHLRQGRQEEGRGRGASHQGRSHHRRQGDGRAHPFQRRSPLSRVLFALGIRHVGKSVAEVLAQRFLTIDTLAAASEVRTSRRARASGPRSRHPSASSFPCPRTSRSCSACVRQASRSRRTWVWRWRRRPKRPASMRTSGGGTAAGRPHLRAHRHARQPHARRGGRGPQAPSAPRSRAPCLKRRATWVAGPKGGFQAHQGREPGRSRARRGRL